MSEINANIVVEPISLTIQQTDPGITITPEPIELNIFTGGYACAQGNTNEVQYNAGGFLAGNPNLLFYSGNGTTVANALKVSTSANLGNVGNVIITGGTANYLLQTDGNGNLNWSNYQSVANANYANFAGEVVDPSQPNITSLGTLISLDVTGNITAGNANLGNAVTANYFIGNGALLTGIDTSLIANGNSNVKVYANANVAITSAGNANILVVTGTGVNVSGTLNITGNLTSNNITATGITANGNIAFTGANVSLGNVANLEILGGNNAQYLQTDGSGNLTWASGTGSGNGTAVGANTQIQYTDGGGNFQASAGFTFNNSSNLFSTPGDANITGNVNAGNANLGNAASANFFIGRFFGAANTVADAAQPNITSVGNLTNLTVTGNVSASYFLGNGSLLTGLEFSEISNGNSNVKVYANANIAISANGTSNVVVYDNNNEYLNANLVVSGTTKIQQATEIVQIQNVGANGNISFNVLNGAILFYTANATSNFTLNLRVNALETLDNVMSTNNSLTCTFLNKNGTTAYYANVIQIDGSTKTVNWASGLYPNLYAVGSGIDVYTFNIIKTAANTYTILGTLTGAIP